MFGNGGAVANDKDGFSGIGSGIMAGAADALAETRLQGASIAIRKQR